MNKLWALIAAMVFSTSALAGSAFAPEVVIESNSAYGALRAVRQSQDNVQYIGCTIYAGKFGGSATCYARNQEGLTKSCSTTGADMIHAVSSISADGTLYFEWDENGECTAVTVHLNSDSILY